MTEQDHPFPTVPTAAHGRGSNGQFGPGNQFAAGAKGHRKAAELRLALLSAVTPGDIEKALTTIRDVMDHGKANERLAAAEALLDRMLGKPVAADLLERIEALEAAMNGEGRSNG